MERCTCDIYQIEVVICPFNEYIFGSDKFDFSTVFEYYNPNIYLNNEVIKYINEMNNG